MDSTIYVLADQSYMQWAERNPDKASPDSKEAFITGFWVGLAYVTDALGIRL